MQSSLQKYGLFYFTLLLFLAVVAIFYLDYKATHRVLTFAMLDVGQGDALFIESPTGTQILVDGGPPRKVLGELRRVVPPFDRRLDAIIITNPDADHIGGFTDVLKHYKVDAMFEPGTYNDSKTYQNLKNEIKEKGIEELLAKRGMRLHLGGGAIIDILFPDRDVSTWTTNDGSLIGKLSYGDTEIMLMGDSTIDTEKIVLAGNTKEYLDSDVIKVGHHGSKTSTSPEFLEATTPEYALISVGAKNSYGHPREEILEILRAAGAKILRTDLDGTIVLRCDRIGPCQVK